MKKVNVFLSTLLRPYSWLPQSSLSRFSRGLRELRTFPYFPVLAHKDATLRIFHRIIASVNANA